MITSLFDPADPSVEWDDNVSQPVTVATLRIPPHTVSQESKVATDCEAMSFNPWPRRRGTPRAQNYRPFIQVVGRDADFIGQPLTGELDLTLENLPLTGTLKFYVQATNPAGDSPKSAVAEVNLG